MRRVSAGTDADSHRGFSLPDRTPAPAGSVSLNSPNNATGQFGISERNEDLVENHVIQDVKACRPQAIRCDCRITAAPLDQVIDSLAAQRSQRRPILPLLARAVTIPVPASVRGDPA